MGCVLILEKRESCQNRVDLTDVVRVFQIYLGSFFAPLLFCLEDDALLRGHVMCGY